MVGLLLGGFEETIGGSKEKLREVSRCNNLRSQHEATVLHPNLIT